MKLVLVGAAAVLVCGCFASSSRSSNFGQLPAAEQARFARCEMPVRAIRCPGLRDVSLSMCLGTSQEHYADGDSPVARKRWLLENGCPASMVEPEPFLAQGAPPQVAPVGSVPRQKDGYDPQAIHQLMSSYDEFKDRTTTSTSTSLGLGLTLYLFAISKGRSPSAQVTAMVVGISEESIEAKHIDSPSLIFLIDDRRVIAGNVSRHEVILAKEGHVIETISTSATMQDLQAFVRASLVRGQLDTTEFAFSPQARADIRAFAERVGAVTLTPTNDGSEYWLPGKPPRR